MCGLLSSADSPPPEPTPPEADSPPFRLLDLAPELVLEIIEHVSSDRRSVFEGAPPELIALSATSSVFSELCRPHVWRAITFPTSPGNDVDLFPDKRTLRALREIQATRTLPIELVRIRGEWGDLDDDEHDQEALVEAVEILASDGLKAVCVEEVMFETFASRRLAERFLRSLARSASLTALQLSQVTVGTTRIRKFLPSIPHLKTLHLKHGSLSLVRPGGLGFRRYSWLGTHSWNWCPSAQTSRASFFGHRAAPSEISCPSSLVCSAPSASSPWTPSPTPPAWSSSRSRSR